MFTGIDIGVSRWKTVIVFADGAVAAQARANPMGACPADVVGFPKIIDPKIIEMTVPAARRASPRSMLRNGAPKSVVPESVLLESVLLTGPAAKPSMARAGHRRSG